MSDAVPVKRPGTRFIRSIDCGCDGHRLWRDQFGRAWLTHAPSPAVSPWSELLDVSHLADIKDIDLSDL